jgi:ElaB/YqjD/DUF883 family membrane-anchored ribosome-binding protein
MGLYEGILSAVPTQAAFHAIHFYTAHGFGHEIGHEVGQGLSLLAQSNPVIIDQTPVVVTQQPVQGGQFLITMLSGVILAFGFQLLMTNLSMAAGVSYVAHSGNSSSSSRSNSSDSHDDSASPIKKISLAFGLWTLITVSVALFFACWLAVRLTIYTDPWSGAITGLVIWATYFTLLMWFSSTAVGSLIGSVVKSATSGFQSIVGTATAAIGAKSASNQMVHTAEAAAAAVRREFTQGLDKSGIQDTLQDYLYSLRSNSVDVASVEQEFERLIRNSDIANVDRDSLPQVNSDMFVKLLSDRTNLSREDTKRLANRLYRVWKNNTGSGQNLSELMNLVASASGGQLASKGLSEQLGKLVEEFRQQRSNSPESSNMGNAGSNTGDDADKNQGEKKGEKKGSNQGNSGPIERAVSQGLNSLISMVLAKTDIPDLDANKIISQIKSAQSAMMGQAGSAIPKPLKDAMPSDNNIIRADVEDYLRHAYIGELKSPELDAAFVTVLYDNEADKTQMREQISGIKRRLFTEVLSSRGMLTQDEIKNIADRLESIRQNVLKEVTAAEALEAESRIRQEMEKFFRYAPASELTSETGEQNFTSLITHEPLQASYLRERLGNLNAIYIRQFLNDRDDIAVDEVTQHYTQLLQRIIADAEGVDKAAKVRLEQQQQSIEAYLRSTGKSELNPDDIKRDLQKLLEEPNEGIRRVRGRLAGFDRSTLVALLAQRPEFSEQEINQVIDSVEESWSSVIHSPQQLAAQAQAKYDEATHAIADYLRNTGKPELNPDDIQRDLQELINHPKVGAQAIRHRLSRMDRDTLVQLLSQRGDMSEDEVNQTIDSMLHSIQNVVKSPRRLARRATSQAKSQAKSFQSALDDYLRNTNKEALNPDGIKRDLRLLLNDPKLGASKLGDRLSQMDDETMVALLSQRGDMTEAEAAEVVGRIANVRHQVKDQIRSVQSKITSVIDGIFAGIREYLESLDRPELDYYGIKRDVRTLFDDPQAGFGALRDRLSQFDRDTLVALLSSHDRISERDVYKVIDQIESARDGVLKKAESVEKQIEGRIKAVKAQTQKQMKDTKQAAEAAAWWLFGTALVSAIVAVLGGLIAVV